MKEVGGSIIEIHFTALPLTSWKVDAIMNAATVKLQNSNVEIQLC
jgi:hypothetical protein